jgi:hypothetical protein
MKDCRIKITVIALGLAMLFNGAVYGIDFAQVERGSLRKPMEFERTNTRHQNSSGKTYMALQSAMEDIKMCIEEWRKMHQGKPVLILLDVEPAGKIKAGKTTLGHAIDINSEDGYYENDFKNLGLDGLKQNVVVVHGDILHDIFDDIRKGVYYPQPWHMPYQVLVDMEYKITTAVYYGAYFKDYIAGLLGKMKKDYGYEDRIIFYEEAGSYYYFETVFENPAAEETLVIKAFMFLVDDKKRKMSLEFYKWGTDGSFEPLIGFPINAVELSQKGLVTEI